MVVSLASARNPTMSVVSPPATGGTSGRILGVDPVLHVRAVGARLANERLDLLDSGNGRAEPTPLAESTVMPATSGSVTSINEGRK